MIEPSQELESEQCRLLQQSQVSDATVLLSNAFFEDPLYEYLLPDSKKRARILPLYFSRFLALAQEVAEVWYIGTPIKGVAIWVAPEQQKECARRLEIARQQELHAIMGQKESERFLRYLHWQDELCFNQNRKSHWYLAVIGVNPEWQKKGIGTLLVRNTLSRADKQEVCCYLETQQKANVPFYLKFGFDITVDGDIEPDSGLAVWTFKRNPTSGRSM